MGTGIPMTRAVALSAEFEPEDAPAGFVEWTFLVPREAPFGSGVYEIRFARLLTAEERTSHVTAAGIAAGGSEGTLVATVAEGEGSREAISQ